MELPNDAKRVGASSLNDSPLNRKNPVVAMDAVANSTRTKRFLKFNDVDHFAFIGCDGTIPNDWNVF